MSFEAGVPGDKYTPELWQTVGCRYYIAGQFVGGRRILEVGCGTGRGLGYLAARAREVIGGDYSRENLGHARAHYRDRAKLLVLDGRHLPFKADTFDAVIAMEVVQYLASAEPFLDECRRVLREAGVLVFCLPNKDAFGFHPSPASRRHYSVPELSSLLARHGFTAEISGAFPVTRQPAWEGIRSAVIVNTGNTLDRLPGGKKIKSFLGRIILNRNIAYKAELEDGDIDAAACILTPLSAEHADKRHRTLYVIARAR